MLENSDITQLLKIKNLVVLVNALPTSNWDSASRGHHVAWGIEMSSTADRQAKTKWQTDKQTERESQTDTKMVANRERKRSDKWNGRIDQSVVVVVVVGRCK